MFKLYCNICLDINRTDSKRYTKLAGIRNKPQIIIHSRKPLWFNGPTCYMYCNYYCSKLPARTPSILRQRRPPLSRQSTKKLCSKIVYLCKLSTNIFLFNFTYTEKCTLKSYIWARWNKPQSNMFSHCGCHVGCMRPMWLVAIDQPA